jgi:hypothetical protein
MKNMLINLDAKNSTKFRSIQDIMKDPGQKAKLNNLVDEAVRAKQRIFTEQQTVKDLREVAKTDLALNPKLFNLYVQATFNNDYTARKDSLDEQLTLIETILGLMPPDHSAYQGHDED